jgi:tetratricopeptide (TPR) repeat protein
VKDQIWIVPVLFIGSLIVVLLNDRRKEKIVRKAERRGRLPPRHLLFVATPDIAPDVFRLIKLLVAGLVAGGVILTIALRLVSRWENPVLFRANRLAGRGNVQAAIALLREHLREQGPTALLYNNLAAFHGMQGEWEESLRLIQEAELLGGGPRRLAANKAVALWKLGRMEQALPCFEEAIRRDPYNLFLTCNYGSLLIQTGRSAEALEQLRRADSLFSEEPGYGAQRRAREEALEAFRIRLADSSEHPEG